MRFYAIYALIANRPDYWNRQGELFTDYEEAVAAMSEVKLLGATLVEAEEMWEFRAVLPEEEVAKRHVEPQ